MTAHTAISAAPSAGTDDTEFREFSRLHRQRQDILQLARQLLQMIKAAQRHRGMSMALLGGNTQFREEFERLQQELERRLLTLQSLVSLTGQLLSKRDQENLHNAWVTIRHDWQQDPVIDNYELHCHLIEQLLNMLVSLSRQLEQPVSSLVSATAGNQRDAGGKGYPNRFKYLEVLHFSTRQMPAVVEQIGRIRALASYAAALGHCDNHHDTKLRYVIQCTRVNNEKLHHQTRRLETILEGDVGLLRQLKSYELKLMFLLNMVEMDILGEGEVTADSNRIFGVATDIIDTYLKVVEDGIALVSDWHQLDLELWLRGE